MSKDHEGDIRQYIHVAEAWYAESSLSNKEHIVDEVMFGFYSPDGGTSGEMGMRWINLGEKWEGAKKIAHTAPRLECFNDAWHALYQFQDVLYALAELDDVDITPEQFCQMLDACGFIDDTPRKYEESYPNKYGVK